MSLSKKWVHTLEEAEEHARVMAEAQAQRDWEAFEACGCSAANVDAVPDFAPQIEVRRGQND